MEITQEPAITYFQVIPRDILRYNFPYIDPKDLRSTCVQEAYKPLCRDEKVLEEYLKRRGLERYLNNVNKGLEWAAEIRSPDFVDYFMKKGATKFDWPMAKAAGGGHREIVELMIRKGATSFNWAMAEAAGGGYRDIVDLMITKGATKFDWAMVGAAGGGQRDIVELMIEKGATDFDLAMG